MRPLTIFSDMDGVMVDFVGRVLQLYNQEYGTNYVHVNVKEWNMNNLELPGTDINKHWRQKNFFNHLTPMKDAPFYVRALIEDGHQFFVTTSSPITGFEDKVESLQKHFSKVAIPDNLVFVHRKDVLCGDIILDDGLHNLRNSQCRYPIVFDQPWNREGADDLLRVHSWEEFYKLVRLISVYNHSYAELLARQRSSVVYQQRKE